MRYTLSAVSRPPQGPGSVGPALWQEREAGHSRQGIKRLSSLPVHVLRTLGFPTICRIVLPVASGPAAPINDGVYVMFYYASIARGEKVCKY
jgi:hypothetical protein